MYVCCPKERVLFETVYKMKWKQEFLDYYPDPCGRWSVKRLEGQITALVCSFLRRNEQGTFGTTGSHYGRRRWPSITGYKVCSQERGTSTWIVEGLNVRVLSETSVEKKKIWLLHGKQKVEGHWGDSFVYHLV